MIQFKCSFYNAPIIGKPYIEIIDVGRYYFNSEECAVAYKQKKLGSNEAGDVAKGGGDVLTAGIPPKAVSRPMPRPTIRL